MSEIPPKHDPDNPNYEVGKGGGQLVAMYNAASHANAESFPVLKAFQDYIEAERAAARKRVIQLSVFFAVLMGVVVTGFLTAGIFMLRNMSEVQNKLLDVALSQRVAPAPAPAPVIQTSPIIEESVRQISRATSDLQASMDKKLEGVSEIAAKVHDRVASQDNEMGKLREAFKQMQEHSAMLQKELVTVKEEHKKAAETAAKTPPAAVTVKPAPAPAAVPPAAVTVKPAPAPAAVLPAAVTVKPAPAPAAVPPAAVTVKPAPAPAAVPPAPVAEPPATAVATFAATKADTLLPPTDKPAAAVARAETPNPDLHFPPALKDPPTRPDDITPPDAPLGMIATTISIKTKKTGTIPWRVLMPE